MGRGPMSLGREQRAEAGRLGQCAPRATWELRNASSRAPFRPPESNAGVGPTGCALLATVTRDEAWRALERGTLRRREGLFLLARTRSRPSLFPRVGGRDPPSARLICLAPRAPRRTPRRLQPRALPADHPGVPAGRCRGAPAGEAARVAPAEQVCGGPGTRPPRPPAAGMRAATPVPGGLGGAGTARPGARDSPPLPRPSLMQSQVGARGPASAL